MPRQAIALHLVEKGIHKANLRPVPGAPGEWYTGNWWISDHTAKQLQGRCIYLHRGQGLLSHIGGEIIATRVAPGGDPKRKVFRFRELPECINTKPPATGWGNEKCVIWKHSEA